MDLLCSEDFESIPFETESDALLLLNEISSATPLLSQQANNGIGMLYYLSNSNLFEPTFTKL